MSCVDFIRKRIRKIIDRQISRKRSKIKPSNILKCLMLCGKHDRFDENNKRRKDLLKKTRTDNEKERHKSASQEREKEI